MLVWRRCNALAAYSTIVTIAAAQLQQCRNQRFAWRVKFFRVRKYGAARQALGWVSARGVLRLLLALLQAGGKALHKHERLYGGAGGLVVLLLVDGLCKCLLGAVAGEFDFVLQGL